MNLFAKQWKRKSHWHQFSQVVKINNNKKEKEKRNNKEKKKQQRNNKEKKKREATYNNSWAWLSVNLPKRTNPSTCRFSSAVNLSLFQLCWHSKILRCSFPMTSLMLMNSVTPWSIIHFSSRVSLGPLLGIFSASGEKLTNKKS